MFSLLLSDILLLDGNIQECWSARCDHSVRCCRDVCRQCVHDDRSGQSDNFALRSQHLNVQTSDKTFFKCLNICQRRVKTLLSSVA